METLFSDVPQDIRMLPERLAFFLSCLRQAIEQELVQLRIHSPSPKLRVTDDVCERHVDILLESHPLHGSPSLDKFRAWAIQTARGPILRGLFKLLAFDLPRSGRR